MTSGNHKHTHEKVIIINENISRNQNSFQYQNKHVHQTHLFSQFQRQERIHIADYKEHKLSYYNVNNYDQSYNGHKWDLHSDNDNENYNTVKLNDIKFDIASSGKMSQMSEEDKVPDSFDKEVDDMLLSSRRKK